MKKVLVLMGAFLAFAACDPVSDCDCTASAEGLINNPLYTEEAATIVEFQGTCDQVTWADLTGEWAELYPEADATELGLTLSCVER
jgi:hypothetical protein